MVSVQETSGWWQSQDETDTVYDKCEVFKVNFSLIPYLKWGYTGECLGNLIPKKELGNHNINEDCHLYFVKLKQRTGFSTKINYEVCFL